MRLISWLLLMPSIAEAQVLLPSYRMVTRDFDVISGANGTLQHLFTIPIMPVYMGVAPHLLQARERYVCRHDMCMHMCM